MFLEISGDLKFGGDYPYYAYKNSSTKQDLTEQIKISKENIRNAKV
jgi:hypothetical protein